MTHRYFSLTIRKIHRYLGIFLGIQFLIWTLSGLYFSWTDLDAIHGDHYKNLDYEPMAFDDLISPSELQTQEAVRTLEIKDIGSEPFYLVNGRNEK